MERAVPHGDAPGTQARGGMTGPKIATIPAKYNVQVELSDRDLEIIRLLVDGMQRKEVAVRMNISLSRMRQLIASIYSRTGVDTRVGLARFAIRHGISAAVLLLAFIFPAHAQIVVNHTSVALFDQIPAQYKTAGQALRMKWVNRSVGENVNQGLTCLSYLEALAPYSCKSATEHWTGTWPRTNWSFGFWPGQGIPSQIACTGYNGMWTGYQPCFLSYILPIIGQFDVVSFQFDYLMAMPGKGLPNYCTNLGGNHDVYDYELAETNNPTKRFIYWTSSLARVIGTAESRDFNNCQRAFATANGKILFDFSDVESHTPSGVACVNGSGMPIICTNYTNEANGGHLNQAGKVRVAKAYWVLMARLAGWNP